jgi:excisionase family DNA binding protein
VNQLSAEEAAALVGVSLHTLHWLIFTKGLPATDAGLGCWTFEESALRQWMEANAAALQSLPNDEERDKLTTRQAMDLLRFRHAGEFNHARDQGLPSYGSSGGERFSREVVVRWFRIQARERVNPRLDIGPSEHLEGEVVDAAEPSGESCKEQRKEYGNEFWWRRGVPRWLKTNR